MYINREGGNVEGEMEINIELKCLKKSKKVSGEEIRKEEKVA